ncbi:M50 family metallopeptidase [Alkalicoccobacillus porphyridii]|uniref:Protease n=1 Tax=Alkalicoccobacillus porphyridii TaxID=2597270 RepID=A0A553ZXX1_9BACI|nr:M50 family metallopeptidase [Alkalicoccobacillus porphyridii]TSB46206.1 protease [Alkalicoccobacillus porphyridii]
MNKVVELILSIRINPFFWVVLGIGIITGFFREALMLFSIVFIHEIGHAAAAAYFGWKVRRIELLPFGGVAEIEDSGNKPIFQELIVVMAGPVQHLWMIALSYILVTTPIWSVANHELFVWHNVIILCFNLLPVLPLDGGRLVQLWFMERWSFRRAHLASLRSSFSALALLCLAASWLPFHLNLYIVITFLIISNYLEWKQRHYRFMRFLAGREKPFEEKMLDSVIRVSPTTQMREMVGLLRRGHQHSFVVDESQKKVTEQQVLAAFFKQGMTIPIRDLFETPPRINPTHIKVQ